MSNAEIKRSAYRKVIPLQAKRQVDPAIILSTLSYDELKALLVTADGAREEIKALVLDEIISRQ